MDRVFVVLVSPDGLRCEIQSPSGTGRRTAFEGGECRYAFWPVDEVRGGIALGDCRELEGDGVVIVEGPICERLRWNMREYINSNICGRWC